MVWDEILDFFEEGWDFAVDGVEYIFSFDWFGDVIEFFGEGFEAMSSIEDSPLSNFWFWLFYICLMAGVWILPSKLGLLDYNLWEKLMYSVIFFITDWFIITYFQNN